MSRSSACRTGTLSPSLRFCGTVTATSPTLGTATLVLSGTRIVLNANVHADCQGHLHVDFRGVLQVRGTLTFTSTTGLTITFDPERDNPVERVAGLHRTEHERDGPNLRHRNAFEQLSLTASRRRQAKHPSQEIVEEGRADGPQTNGGLVL
jgi:hypothetical protein